MQEDELTIQGGDDGNSMGTVTLMLGLYLIILALFILLNAISSDSPERRDIVVESVNEGFDFRDAGDNRGSDDAEISMMPLYHSVENNIEGVIEAYLSMDEYKLKMDSERVIVEMDTKRFFRPKKVALIPEMVLFFEDLASILEDSQTGMRMESQILVKQSENINELASGMSPMEMAGRRSALFVRALIESGASASWLSAGAMIGDNRIIMTMDLFVEDYAKATEEALKLQNVFNIEDIEDIEDLKQPEQEEFEEDTQ